MIGNMIDVDLDAKIIIVEVDVLLRNVYEDVGLIHIHDNVCLEVTHL